MLIIADRLLQMALGTYIRSHYMPQYPQAYIDACSTADIKYTKDTPSARLLYVNEVKSYKQDVQQ